MKTNFVKQKSTNIYGCLHVGDVDVEMSNDFDMAVKNKFALLDHN